MGREAADQGAHKIAAAEFLKVEIVVRRSAPQAQAVDGLPTKADDGSIKRDANQGRGAAGHNLQIPAMHLERAAKFELDGFVAARYLPRVVSAQPIIRTFALPTIFDG